MRNINKQQSGFALLEILMATLLLGGIIYLFTLFNQTQSLQVNKEIIGKHLAILVNDIFESNPVGGSCSAGLANNKPLLQCIPVSAYFQSTLKKDGFDTQTALFTHAAGTNTNKQNLIELTFYGKFNELDSAIYMQKILNNLSKSTMQYLATNGQNKIFDYRTSSSGDKITFSINYSNAL